MGDVIVIAVLAGIVAWILYTMRKDRKAGRHCCSGNCGSCKGCHRAH